jgi:hypothetical protein
MSRVKVKNALKPGRVFRVKQGFSDLHTGALIVVLLECREELKRVWYNNSFKNYYIFEVLINDVKREIVVPSGSHVCKKPYAYFERLV